jgi:integrase
VSTSVDHLHPSVRDTLKLPSDFVVYGLRHTKLTRLGEAGVDAFTIMKIAGHSSITVGQKYIHPSPEAFERLEKIDAKADEKTELATFLDTVPVLSESVDTANPLN